MYMYIYPSIYPSVWLELRGGDRASRPPSAAAPAWAMGDWDPYAEVRPISLLTLPLLRLLDSSFPGNSLRRGNNNVISY